MNIMLTKKMLKVPEALEHLIIKYSRLFNRQAKEKEIA